MAESDYIIVLDHVKTWHLNVQGAEVVSAKAFLLEDRYAQRPGCRVFNLCRSYRYQTLGYYVSLLAGARGQRAIPDIITLQDLRSPVMIKTLSEDLDELINSSLRDIKSDEFVLSIYFGKNMAKAYERLAKKLFNLFEAPLLRARFLRRDSWELVHIAPIAVNEIPESHRAFFQQSLEQYFAKKSFRKSQKAFRYHLGLLVDPSEPNPPSDAKALERFERAAEDLGLSTEIMEKDDYSRLAEFDALFIRATTKVNHFTYRFARRAEAEGLVVIDDPTSIIRCSNKVYLAELLERLKVPHPKTVIIHKDRKQEYLSQIQYPCVLKRPDSSFSAGVVKAETKEEFTRHADAYFEDSDLLIVQEFIPTDFDWRIGLLNGKPLYACQYFMARQHWQIIQRDGEGRWQEGEAKTFPLAEVPWAVIRTALKVCQPVGKGFYGVDIKMHQGVPYVVEVNDNPSLESGVEDAVMKDDLYKTIMAEFLRRIEENKKP